MSAPNEIQKKIIMRHPGEAEGGWGQGISRCAEQQPGLQNVKSTVCA
jgi:hypothetical protein